MKLTFNVNGKSFAADVPGDTPLLWVLRDALGLPGTKYGCGVAACGACTVHVDGEATRSCQVPASSVGGAKITTIEGLSSDGTHPVQRAWREIDVPQCGYCQPGQIMAAVAKVKQKGGALSDADFDEIRNICRCGTYHRIREAINAGAANM
jgi:isoquinoline 1-oxidoreductase alpha subunit